MKQTNKRKVKSHSDVLPFDRRHFLSLLGTGSLLTFFPRLLPLSQTHSRGNSKNFIPGDRLFYSAEELLKRPIMKGMSDKTHLYFHFRPARPADIVVTRDPDTGDLDLTPQTFGILTDNPLTICLHTNRGSSPHSTRNLGTVGAEAVVALPGPDLIWHTWAVCVPMPRGVNEGEAAALESLPSRIVSIPGIANCPVNLECKVELVRERYSHNAVFLRVLGATIDEELLNIDRAEIIRRGPTYEVDDMTNKWNGSIERLGTNYDLLDCPGFPVVAKKGSESGVTDWIEDLKNSSYLSEKEYNKIIKQIKSITGEKDSSVRREKLTKVFEMSAWEEWDKLHTLLASL